MSGPGVVLLGDYNRGTFQEAAVTRKTVVLTTIGAIVVGVALQAFRQDGDPLDPVRVAPDTHRVAFENMFVRVLEVRVPPGASSLATAIPTA